MESLGFLKYLRVGGAAVAGAHRAPATTIAASACDEDGGGGAAAPGDVDDDASFFDLEFAVPEPGDESAASDADAEEERVEFNFAVAGDDGGKADSEAEVEEAVAPAPPPASPLGPVTKFRVLLLKLRRPAKEAGQPAAPAPKQQAASRLLIKFRVDESAPLASLFTRDNSSRTSDAADRPASAAVAQQAHQDSAAAAGGTISAEERRFAKEVVLRYLSKIKPLYVKVSRRYGDRLRFAGEESDLEEPDHHQHTGPAAAASPSPSQAPPPVSAAVAVVACGVRAPRASVPAGLKQVCKRLGKSRSASSAVAAAPPPPTPVPSAAAAAGGAGTQPQRRDDSLLQLQDGIQSAIAHCKRSFNASKGSESPVLRSMATTTAAGEAKDGGGA